MNSYREILKLIREKPTLYIRQRSIFALHVFLLGWYVRSPQMTSDREIMMAFQDWIQKKYRINSTQSWADIILFYSINDAEAFEKFFELFDEFMQEYNKKG
jgi:hypothetical protein